MAIAVCQPRPAGSGQIQVKGINNTSTIHHVTGVELVLVGMAAVATAVLTALAGAGGGLVLLIVLLQFVEPAVAIPAHGIVQFLSNGTRAVALRKRVEPAVLRCYLLPLVPAMVVGFLIADAVPVGASQAVIGLFALVAVWWPAATAWLAPRAEGSRRMAAVGVVAGVTNPTIGAPGPLLSPAFRSAVTDHPSFVATFSVAQVANHVVKVAIVALAGFAWSEHLRMIAVAAVGVVVGTRVGVRFLDRADPEVLGRVFQVVVTIGALRLVGAVAG